jgi:S-adenosylmethionine:tRNA ribosyltransferase-isomerase
LIKKSRKLKEGEILISENTKQKFVFYSRYHLSILKVCDQLLDDIFFQKEGEIPIPPYFKRKPDDTDKIRYQTIFAKNSGSLAAPTAGLHFTDELKANLESRGVGFTGIELKIGYGTFAPLQEVNFIKGKLHKEFYSINSENAKMMKSYRQVPRKLIAIGTTTLRALESAYDNHIQEYTKLEGTTDLFIRPEDHIYSIDGLITNFHLPKSSLLLLVSAFMGVDLTLEAYRIAIQEKMRFFSYGDAMLII